MTNLETAAGIAAAVAAGRLTATAAIEAALARIAAIDPGVNAFTDVTAARARARRPRSMRASPRDRRRDRWPGVPFAVKNLFDVEGIPTRAGSKINRDNPAASRDAALVRRLEAAARSSSAPSTWANTPTTSPARTPMTAPRATRTTASG